MSDKRSLSAQRQAVEHIIALCPDAGETIIEAAKQACLSIAWIERRADLVREMARLDKAEPALAVLLSQIPDLKISDIRIFADEEADDV